MEKTINECLQELNAAITRALKAGEYVYDAKKEDLVLSEDVKISTWNLKTDYDFGVLVHSYASKDLYDTAKAAYNKACKERLLAERERLTCELQNINNKLEEL